MKIAALFVVGVCSLSVVSSHAAGADRGSVPEKVLQQLEFMVGQWAESTEGVGGPERCLQHKREWLPGKHGLLVTWSGLFDGVRVDASGIVGWDRTTNLVTEHWYLSDGTYFATVYPVDKMTDSVWEGTTSWVEPDGRRVVGTCRLEKQGNDQFTWVATLKDGDKVQPPYKVVTRRVVESKADSVKADAQSSAAPATNAPALLKEYGELMVGEWECKACVPWGAAPGSGKVPARATCRWAAGGAALDWDIQIGDQKAVALTWWDPVAKQLKELGIGASGGQFDLVITKEADKWNNQATMTLPDGKRIEIRTVTTFSKEGDRHVNDYTDHQDVFTRVKR